LAGHIGGQFADPRSWLPVGVVLAALGMIPAMPQSVFLPAAAVVFWLAWMLKKRAGRAIAPDTVEEKPSPEAIAIEDVSDLTLVTIELGYGLVHLVDEARGAPLVTRITGVRKQLSQECGFIVPQFRVRDSLDLAPHDYRILLGGVPIGAAAMQAGKILAIDTGEVGAHHMLAGIATQDPSFGCPALWIDPGARDDANAEGFLTVDPATIIATHLNQLLIARTELLLGVEEVRGVLDALKERMPGLVEAVHPEPLTLAALTRLLKALLADGITLTHPLPLFASLANALQQTQDFDAVIDRIRVDLGDRIVGTICPPHATLSVITLDAQLESTILQGMRDPVSGQPLIDPDLAADIGAQVAELIAASATPPALIVQPPIRRTIARLLKQRAPGCLVLSIAELPASQPVEVRAVIGAANPSQPIDTSEPESIAA
ncbi:MAG: FHIPEP family type III secretion protein, partial [Pontixanthobacter sp.]